MVTCDLTNQINIIKDDSRNTWDMKQTGGILGAEDLSGDGRNEESGELAQRKVL